MEIKIEKQISFKTKYGTWERIGFSVTVSCQPDQTLLMKEQWLKRITDWIFAEMEKSK